MAHCEVCGNEYQKSFEVIIDNRTHVFDSFECAIQSLAPTCARCGCKIIGHGVQRGTEIFCCDHCARHQGGIEMTDAVMDDMEPSE